MGTHKIEDLLRTLGQRGIERPRPELGQEIKNRIPHRLISHRLDTVNIIIDLRVSRLAAAAAIILVVLVIGSCFGGRDAVSRRMYEDGKLFLRYALSGDDACKAQVLGNLSQFRDDLEARGREVVYYGDTADVSSKYAIVMHWKLSDDKYGVILGDLSARTVSTKTLITLQNHMLLEKKK